MKKAIYSGMLIVCLAAIAMPAVAKGKPQKAHKTQTTEQSSESTGTTSRQKTKPMMCQGRVGLPQLPGTTQQHITQQQTTSVQQQSTQGAIAQQTNVTTTSVSQVRNTEMQMTSDAPMRGQEQNLRSNRGGQLRGQARAQQVHEMNAAKGETKNHKCAHMKSTASSSGSTQIELHSDH